MLEPKITKLSENYSMPMKNIDINDPEAQSTDLVADNIEQLKNLFPELITEGVNGVSVNVDVLRALVGDKNVTDADEKYGLNWHGKRRARQLALTPSTGTLLPCPEESVDWDTTKNLMIEGDNLEVLKLMQKSYSGKVKLIYIDPPYNTGKDFVYPDNFQDNINNYLELTGQVESGQKISSNTESSGRFHTEWLNMMYPRLKLARNLLREDGAIFISIDENEAKNLILIMNEIFGEENAVLSAVWRKRVSPANDAKWFSSDHDLIVIYAKNKDVWRPKKLPRNAQQLSNYKNPDNDPRGPWNSATYTCNKSKDERPNLFYPIRNPNTGEGVWPKETAVWKYGPEVTALQQKDNRLYWGADGLAAFPRVKLFLSEMDNVVPRSVWDYEDVGHTQEATTELKALFDGNQVFDSPKPVRLLQRIIDLCCDSSNDLILDFFAGSGTTGHASYSRSVSGNPVRFILIQLPEPLVDNSFRYISDITKERLRRSATKIKADNPEWQGDVGFRVFKLAHSNIRAWNPKPENLEATLLDFEDHLIEGRSEADILYELLLKLGLDLCVPIEKRIIAEREVYSIGGGVLIACLAEQINSDLIEPLALGIVDWRKELTTAGDTTCVFRDGAFTNDVAKTNLAAILEQHGIQNVRSL